MQSYDFIMLMVLGGLTMYGYFKGMAWQLAYFASFVASYFIALRFADRIAPVFGDAAPWNKFMAMLAIYAASSLGIWMVFRVIRRGIDAVRLEGFDRQMGALVGFARGVLWCVAITFFAVGILPQGMKEQVLGSRSGHYIALLLHKTDKVVPPEVRQVIGPYLDRAQERLAPGQQPFAASGGGGGGWPQSAGTAPAPAWPQQANAAGWPAAAPTPPAGGASAWPGYAPQVAAQPRAGYQAPAAPSWPQPQQPAAPAWP